MSVAKSVTRAQIYSLLYRAHGIKSDQRIKRRLAELIPNPIRVSDGRVNGAFLPYFANQFVLDIPGKASAEELIAAFEREKLSTAIQEGRLVKGLDLGNVYKAMVREREHLLGSLDRAKAHRLGAKRSVVLHDLVLALGEDIQENQKTVAQTIQKLFGFSGVRVYTVDLEKNTWKHNCVIGEEGVSRFNVATAPKGRSEKGYLNRLLRGEVPDEEIQAAKKEDLYEWHINGRWGYFYIPDRSRCAFVEKDQLQRDEKGDESQQRNGYGEGVAREILYLIFGGRKSKAVEAYLITNWVARAPLFTDKEKDLKLLHAFAVSALKSKKLIGAIQKWHDLAIVDELTQVFNRRKFYEEIEREVNRAERYEHPLSLLMIDIDLFKRVNDAHGHQAGDKVLQETARLIRENVRNVDIVARYGGEEFVVLLPETNAEGEENTYKIAERLRAAIEGHVVTVKEGVDVSVTVSIGIATYPVDAKDPANLITAADQALYEAKRGGRNQIVHVA